MSTKVIASVASLLAVLLPLFGVNLGTAELTTTIQSIVVIASALWVWFRTVKKEGLSPLGFRR